MPSTDQQLPSRSILGMRVDSTTYAGATERILGWAERSESRYVCVAAVNNVISAQDDPSFMDVMNGSDLTTSDGMPLVWGLRQLGLPDAQRVYGPELTLHICEAARDCGTPIGLYGGHPDVLAEFEQELVRRFPGLEIAYRCSPPFRALSDTEQADIVEEIRTSGARIVLVGLGAPKQERWIAAHRGQIPAVLVGVGAAFDFIAGRTPQAPAWMQRLALEWLFRLFQEPRRLWRRYMLQNPRFIVLFGRQLLRARRGHRSIDDGVST